MSYKFEAERQEHMQKHGSFLYCEDRDTLCTFKEEEWRTGQRCSRRPCIIDDPENIAQQKRIEQNRKAQIETERQHRKEEKDAAPIRDQRNQIKNYINMKLDEIHRIEERSRQAYQNNRPKEGDTLFNRARIMRGELRRFEKERLKESR